MIRRNVKSSINGYFDYPALKDMDNFIVPASFGDNTGVKGSLALALDILDKAKPLKYYLYFLQLLINFIYKNLD